MCVTAMNAIDESKLIDGRSIAKTVLEKAAARVETIKQETGVTPTLATVIVGDDPASHTYVRMKRKRCEQIGMRPVRTEMPEGTTTEELVAELERLANDDSVHGILLQHPVPKPIDRRIAFETIPVEKDVDGVTSGTLGRLILGMKAFFPCTPRGIMRLLHEYDVDLDGAEAVVIGRSPILGRPMASMLINARTRGLSNLVRRADIVIAAVGKPRYIKGNWIKPGSVVIDAGYNEGNIGDVDFDGALERAALITPVPGGVGPMTIAMLLDQTVDAAAQQLGLRLPTRQTG
jgi:methylenetetrahydrofolate dehydrogenase (NADP+)/methenyltetrahydrofolate cyclohydrolase